MRPLALILMVLLAPLGSAAAQQKVAVPAGGTLQINVTPATPAPPPVSITLNERHGHVTPSKGKCTHTGGGNIDVQTPAADTVVVTMTGICVADSHMDFDLEQCFEVSFDKPTVKKAKLTVEGRVIGLLRGEKKACAEYSDACATMSCGPAEIITLCVPPHKVCHCENLSVNDHDGPRSVPVMPGKYTLHQKFHIAAYGGCWLTKKASAEFAPDPALDPLWISCWEPFHGVAKKDFGFQVAIKVADDSDSNGDKKEEAPAPKGEKKEP